MDRSSWNLYRSGRQKLINLLSHTLLVRLASVVNAFIRILNIVVAILLIGAIVVDYGFELSDGEMSLIKGVYTFGWWIYFVSFTIRLPFLWRQIRKKNILLTTILGLTLYVSALPHLFSFPTGSQFLADLWSFLENKYFVIALLGTISVIELSRSITYFINRKTNPALLVVVSFAVIIAFGTILLMLPRSTMEHIQLPVIDALFTSTSAVCVTGLTTIDVAQTFTTEGQIIIALLVQIGGLGIMTITSFFTLFFMNGMSLYSQFSVRDMMSSRAESLMSTLMSVLGFTLVIELAGAFFVWLSIHPVSSMTMHEELFFSIFHSISAFCNAGFSTMDGNLGNELVFVHNNMFFIVISMLITLGGLGFPVFNSLRKLVKYHLTAFFKNLFRRRNYARYAHLLDANAKIVLYTTAGLILFGALFIGIVEWNGAFAGMSTDEKIVQSLFNSILPRTAGFNSVSVGEFSRITIFVIIFLMWIGGGSQSTAGGIKVNTFAVAFASIKSMIRGRSATELCNREIPYNTIRRTLTIVFGSLIIIAVFFIALLVLEPAMPAMSLLFETVSAFSTVGSSMGITSEFCYTSKLLIIVLMFIGRVGLITVLMSVVPTKKNGKYKLPKEDVIIN